MRWDFSFLFAQAFDEINIEGDCEIQRKNFLLFKYNVFFIGYHAEIHFLHFVRVGIVYQIFMYHSLFVVRS